MRSEIRTSGANTALSRIGIRVGRIRSRSKAKAFRSILLSACLAAWSMSALSADDYLSELDDEAKKVEASGIDAEPGTDTVEAPSPSVPSEPARQEEQKASRKAFERQLREHYLGSYGFYKKLPERSREEVFQEYREGADMGKLRKKIIDRLLQH